MKKLIREFMMDCPMCDKVHMIKEYEDITTDIIKDEAIMNSLINFFKQSLLLTIRIFHFIFCKMKGYTSNISLSSFSQFNFNIHLFTIYYFSKNK